MVITSVFQSGNSQAVRIPKSMRLRSKRASICLEEIASLLLRWPKR